MTLLQRQIKALHSTLEQVVGECERREGHDWASRRCPLCRLHCDKCPILYWVGYRCTNLREEYEIKRDPADTPVIADFIYSLILYLEGK